MGVEYWLMLKEHVLSKDGFQEDWVNKVTIKKNLIKIFQHSVIFIKFVLFHFLGGGLGGTRRGGPEVNLKHSGREDNERERERYAREMAGSRSGRSVTTERDRERDYRDRDRDRETRRPRSRDRERKRHRSKS